MPCRDGTGPRGQGPMTGHGGGDCVLRESQRRPGCFYGILGRHGRPATLNMDSSLLPFNSPCLKSKRDQSVKLNRLPKG
ncbi:MAG: DUF5320 domain-containing protein [Phycisphaerae bacterium]|nr:DUF5320 domain-containing protein [Phycisphaerae bacterium]